MPPLITEGEMRLLKQVTTGRVYAYTEALAKRKDMVLLEPKKKVKKGKKPLKDKELENLIGPEDDEQK